LTAYHFTAVLSLFSTENGGRKKPVFDHFRPSFLSILLIMYPVKFLFRNKANFIRVLPQPLL